MKILPLIKTAAADWSDDEASRLAAALAFYTVLSLAPMLVLAVSVAGLFFGDDAAKGQIASQLTGVVGPQAAAALESIIQSAKAPEAGVVGSIVGIATLLLGASGVFGELQSSLNQVWEVAPKPKRGIMGIIRDRFFSFAMVLGVAFLLLVSLVLSTAITALGTFMSHRLPLGEGVWRVLNFVLSFGATSALFALMYKVIPDVKIGWREVWFGGFVTALLFTIGKTLLGFYLGRSSVSSAYGAAGSLVALVVWVYYSAQILLFGAELTQAHAKQRGVPIVPKKNAVPAKRSEETEPEQRGKMRPSHTGA